MKKYFLALVICGVAFSGVLAAQDAQAPKELPKEATAAAKSPELTDVQKLQITNLIKDMQLAQLQIELAQRNYQASSEAAKSLVQSLQKECYELDIQTMTYKAIEGCKPKK
jgi:multidrug efflux pump subunit AcrA (membrane-fusion protein)